MISADDLATLYQTDYARMVDYVNRRISDPHEAEDIVSNAFCHALEHCQDIQHMSGYVYRSLRNGMIDRARKYKGKQIHPLDELTYDYRQDFEPELYTEIELYDIIRHSRLTQLQQQVIAYLLAGYVFLEIAQLMQMSEGGVKALRHRALCKMQQVRHQYAEGHNSHRIPGARRRRKRVRYG